MIQVKGIIHDHDFPSEFLNETIPIYIYTPPHFSKEKAYPYMIVHDAKDYFQFGRLIRYSNELIEQGKIKEFLIIGIHYKNVEDRRKKFHPEGEENEAFLKFLALELVPWIDSKYPTTSSRNDRTLMGDSLAGTVSLLAALKFPEIFGRLILHSPYVDENVLQQFQEFTYQDNLDIYHVIGKEETVVAISNNRNFLTPNRKLHQLILQKGFSTFYDEFDGGHSWKFWQSDVRRALLKMFCQK